MKKIVVLLVLVSTSFLYSQNPVKSKYDNFFAYKFDKGHSFIGAFVTNEKYWGADKGLDKTQGFEVQYEYYFIDWLSIGGFASYSRSNFDFDNKGEYESKYTDFTFGAMLNRQLFYFDPFGTTSNLFSIFGYAGARVGYKSASVKVMNEEPTYKGMLGGAHLGVRVILSQKLSAQIELGAYYTNAHKEPLGSTFGYGRAGISYSL